ncbi:hypothetical protein [Gordonia alkaliphila]|uniref:Head-to-tail stopper n=1 Tax=Gordonia alkaliphila TaxID=1053547 RepID=A0ABP8ZK52_9ACTN
MSFPTRYLVEVREFVDGPPDDFGVAEPAWTEWASTAVYGWGAPNTTEPKTAGHDRQIVELEVLVPPGFPDLSHRAQVRLPGLGEFDVIGSVERYDHSPFGWNPGAVVNVKKVHG